MNHEKCGSVTVPSEEELHVRQALTVAKLDSRDVWVSRELMARLILTVRRAFEKYAQVLV